MINVDHDHGLNDVAIERIATRQTTPCLDLKAAACFRVVSINFIVKRRLTSSPKNTGR